MTVLNGRCYGNEVSASRAGAYSKAMSFDAVVDMLVASANGYTYQAKRGSVEAKGCTRAEFSLSVTPEAYDLFFNSSSGYRAHFYMDHRLGAKKNREVLDRLAPRLLSVATGTAGFTSERVRASLYGASAKIWINEGMSTLDRGSIDAESLIAIAVPHWVTCARKAAARILEGKHPRPASMHKALLGIQAPEGRELRVFGAWLDDVTASEFVVPSKRNRSREIRVYGFA